MPKEIIASRFNATGNFAVQVGWGRDLQDVRIASVNLDKDDRFSPEYGWFTHLDRDEINRLIRVLRKARDQAYGADE